VAEVEDDEVNPAGAFGDRLCDFPGVHRDPAGDPARIAPAFELFGQARVQSVVAQVARRDHVKTVNAAVVTLGDDERLVECNQVSLVISERNEQVGEQHRGRTGSMILEFFVIGKIFDRFVLCVPKQVFRSCFEGYVPIQTVRQVLAVCVDPEIQIGFRPVREMR
jgi:hypothetical protein